MSRPVLVSFDERAGTVDTSRGVFDYYTLRSEYDLNGDMDVIRLCEIEGFDEFKYLVFASQTEAFDLVTKQCVDGIRNAVLNLAHAQESSAIVCRPECTHACGIPRLGTSASTVEDIPACWFPPEFTQGRV